MTGGIDMLESRLASGRNVLRSFSDIAILCRTHNQADLIENCLRHDSIPCIVMGRENYLETPEVCGTLAFSRFLLNPRDFPSLHLIWNCPSDLIDEAVSYFRIVKKLNPAACLKEFEGLGVLPIWAKAVETYFPIVKKEKPRKLLERRTERRPLSAPMNRLLQAAVFHSSMEVFLQNLLLGQEGDLKRASGKGYESGAVRLMTLRGSKGSEFPVVFLAGVKKETFRLNRNDIKPILKKKSVCYLWESPAQKKN